MVKSLLWYLIFSRMSISIGLRPQLFITLTHHQSTDGPESQDTYLAQFRWQTFWSTVAIDRRKSISWTWGPLISVLSLHMIMQCEDMASECVHTKLSDSCPLNWGASLFISINWDSRSSPPACRGICHSRNEAIVTTLMKHKHYHCNCKNKLQMVFVCRYYLWYWRCVIRFSSFLWEANCKDHIFLRSHQSKSSIYLFISTYLETLETLDSQIPTFSKMT